MSNSKEFFILVVVARKDKDGLLKNAIAWQVFKVTAESEETALEKVQKSDKLISVSDSTHSMRFQFMKTINL